MGRCRARPIAFMGQAAQTPGLANVFTLFNASTPRVYADIDRTKADMLGVPPERVFEALQVYLGSAYVNDFNLLGRTYRVTAQADSRFRDDTADIAQLKTRSNSGGDGADRLDRDLRGPHRPVSGDPLQPVPGGRDGRRGGARHLDRRGAGEDGADRLEPAARLPHRMDRHRLSAEGRRQHRRASSSGWRWCSSSSCSPRSSKA